MGNFTLILVEIALASCIIKIIGNYTDSIFIGYLAAIPVYFSINAILHIIGFWKWLSEYVGSEIKY